ncbi:MAG: DUF1704 domain-containing protein [Bacteroidales bacterium]|nr:DUF1704 domain-containing protein [Bacteroidales bacterium]
MQKLSLEEIISNIEQGICFEASHNDNFFVKIHEYVPYVCTAIHNGHRFRPELRDICLLNESERLYEEDPHTADFITSLPITIIAGDSRYEYDLNRTEDECIYDVAWGRKVWKRPLTQEERETSLTKHRQFYKVTQTLVARLEKDYGATVIYDMHSYNHQRHPITFTFNLGIENIDIRRYNPQISFWKKQLQSVVIRKKQAGVSVNHIFYGRGYLLKFIKERFSNSLVLSTEVKKIYMNELTGQPYPLVIQQLAKGLKNAIINNSQFYINSLANFNVKKQTGLLYNQLQPDLLKLDTQLYKMVRNFEILSFVNPVNIESEKKKFIKSRYTANPEFRYKPLTIDPFAFKAKMYKLNVDAIEDIHIKQIYIDIINAYADKVDMLANLGTEKFLYNSLRYFGEPSSKDIANANFLMYCNELPQFEAQDYLSIKRSKRHFF